MGAAFSPSSSCKVNRSRDALSTPRLAFHGENADDPDRTKIAATMARSGDITRRSMTSTGGQLALADAPMILLVLLLRWQPLRCFLLLLLLLAAGDELVRGLDG